MKNLLCIKSSFIVLERRKSWETELKSDLSKFYSKFELLRHFYFKNRKWKFEKKKASCFSFTFTFTFRTFYKDVEKIFQIFKIVKVYFIYLFSSNIWNKWKLIMRFWMEIILSVLIIFHNVLQFIWEGGNIKFENEIPLIHLSQCT